MGQIGVFVKPRKVAAPMPMQPIRVPTPVREPVPVRRSA